MPAPTVADSSGAQTTGAGPLTITGKTVLAGEDLVVLMAYREAVAIQIGSSAVAWGVGPQALQLVQSLTSGVLRHEVWRLINPTPGSADIVATLNGSNLLAAGCAVSVNGWDQVVFDYETLANSTAAPQIATPSVPANTLCLAAFTSQGISEDHVPDADQTQLFETTGSNRCSFHRKATTAFGTVTMGVTFTTAGQTLRSMVTLPAPAAMGDLPSGARTMGVGMGLMEE